MSLAAIEVVAWLSRRANLRLEPSVVKAAGNGEITAVAAVAVGAAAGFLWFNRYPSRWFMGAPAWCRWPEIKSKKKSENGRPVLDRGVLCAAGGLACLQFGGAVSATKGLNNGLATSYASAITSWWR